MRTGWIILTLTFSIHQCTGDVINIAINKPASVSSTYTGGLTAGGVVDGHITTVWPKTIHTDLGSSSAWWNVDLQLQVKHATVKIYFRTDYKLRRNGVQIYTSTTPFSTYPEGQLCHTITGSPDGTDIPDVVSVDCSGSWRHLMIYTQTDNDGHGAILNFGEVEVLVCTSGTYGPGCQHSCGDRECIDSSSTCDHVTGQCTGGCKPGWNGTDCTLACSSGTYGPDCNFTCGNCEGTDICHHVTGSCPGDCQAGWQGQLCQQACQRGAYGVNCLKSCGKCNGTCDLMDGQCQEGCQEGYCGTKCQFMIQTASSTVTAYAIGSVIGVVLMLLVNGGILLCLTKHGRLQWMSTSTSEVSKQASHKSNPGKPNDQHSAQSVRNNYEVFDIGTESDYDVVQDPVYEETQ